MKEARHKRLHIIWFHSYEIPGKANLQKAKKWLPGAGQGLTVSDIKETFSGYEKCSRTESH